MKMGAKRQKHPGKAATSGLIPPASRGFCGATKTLAPGEVLKRLSSRRTEACRRPWLTKLGVSMLRWLETSTQLVRR